jgi:redox-sensing transcriptional repressor
MIECGILAIWNFAPVRIVVPKGILVHNENMAASLALLSKHLKKGMINLKAIMIK